MGTNYYLINKREKERHDEFAVAFIMEVDKLKRHLSAKFPEFNEVLENWYYELPEQYPAEMHIGKLSSGWRFSFHQAFPCLYAVQQKLQSVPELSIFDEYGRQIDYENFQEIVVKARENPLRDMAGNLVKDAFLYRSLVRRDEEYLNEDGDRVVSRGDFS